MSADKGREAGPVSGEHPSGASPRAALRVLVVDDHADSCKAIGRLLQMFGCDVATAETGKQALELAQSHCPDAVLLDLGLPDLSGYEVLAELKQLEQLTAAKFIALSGYDSDADRQEILAAGFHHHLVKPAKPDELLAILVRKSSHGDPD